MTKTRIQILTFVVIGLSNTLVHGAVLAALVERFGVHLVMAHLISFGVANLISFYLNSQYTFKLVMSWRRYMKFLTASLVSLLLTLAISSWAQWYGLAYWQGFIGVIFLVPIFSFSIMKFWAFNAKPRANAK